MPKPTEQIVREVLVKILLTPDEIKGHRNPLVKTFEYKKENISKSLWPVYDLAMLLLSKELAADEVQEERSSGNTRNFQEAQARFKQKESATESNDIYKKIVGFIDVFKVEGEVDVDQVVSLVRNSFEISPTEKMAQPPVKTLPVATASSKGKIDPKEIETDIARLIEIFGNSFYEEELDNAQIIREAVKIRLQYVQNKRLASEDVSRALDCLLHKHGDIAIISRTQFAKYDRRTGMQIYEEGDLSDVADLIRIGNFPGKRFLAFADLSLQHFTATTIDVGNNQIYAIDSLNHTIDMNRYSLINEAAKEKLTTDGKNLKFLQLTDNDIMQQDSQDVTLCGAHTIINLCLTIFNLKAAQREPEKNLQEFKKIVNFLFGFEEGVLEGSSFKEVIAVMQLFYESSDEKDRQKLEEKVIILAAINAAHFKSQALPQENQDEELLHAVVESLGRNVAELAQNLAKRTRMINIMQAQKSISHSFEIDHTLFDGLDSKIKNDPNYKLLQKIIADAKTDEERKVENIAEKFLLHRPSSERMVQRRSSLLSRGSWSPPKASDPAPAQAAAAASDFTSRLEELQLGGTTFSSSGVSSERDVIDDNLPSSSAAKASAQPTKSPDRFQPQKK